MGKRLLQQRRGKGDQRFRSPGFRYLGHSKILNKESYTVKELTHSPGHTAPVMKVEYSDGTEGVIVAPEGVVEGETYQINQEDAEIAVGNVMQLADIPEGTLVSNIELKPGDGGKIARGSGSGARVVNKSEDAVTVLLPSKSTKDFNPQCNAMIGNTAGGGRTEKPFLKAGTKHFAMKARNKFYPSVSGNAMNAVAHPFGNKRSLRKSKAKPAPRNAPPGRKVGSIRPRQQGRKR